MKAALQIIYSIANKFLVGLLPLIWLGLIFSFNVPNTTLHKNILASDGSFYPTLYETLEESTLLAPERVDSLNSFSSWWQSLVLSSLLESLNTPFSLQIFTENNIDTFVLWLTDPDTETWELSWPAESLNSSLEANIQSEISNSIAETSFNFESLPVCEVAEISAEETKNTFNFNLPKACIPASWIDSIQTTQSPVSLANEEANWWPQSVQNNANWVKSYWLNWYNNRFFWLTNSLAIVAILAVVAFFINGPKKFKELSKMLALSSIGWWIVASLVIVIASYFSSYFISLIIPGATSVALIQLIGTKIILIWLNWSWYLPVAVLSLWIFSLLVSMVYQPKPSSARLNPAPQPARNYNPSQQTATGNIYSNTNVSPENKSFGQDKSFANLNYGIDSNQNSSESMYTNTSNSTANAENNFNPSNFNPSLNLNQDNSDSGNYQSYGQEDSQQNEHIFEEGIQNSHTNINPSSTSQSQSAGFITSKHFSGEK